MRRVARAVVALAVATAAGVTVAGAASADTATPIWQVGGSSYATLGDASNVGTLAFFDASGNQITTGSAATGFSYVEADGIPADDLTSGETRLLLQVATPVPATPAGTFPTKPISVSTAWPNAAAPGALATDANPLFSGPLATAQNDSLDIYAKTYPQTSTTAGYSGVYEVRAFLTGRDGLETDYASADVQVDSATDTWTQIFPSVTVTTPPSTPVGTATGVTVSPGTGVPNSSQTLTATVTAGSGSATPAGTVDFTDGATDLGSRQLTGSGTAPTATLQTTALGAGSHTITATFTPTDPTAFSGSSGSATPFSLTAVTPPANAIATTTTLDVDPGSGQALSQQTLTATVTAASGSDFPPGTVDFTDNGTDLGTAPVGAGSGSSGAAGVATLPLTLHGGAHAISASFTPTDPTAFVASSTASAQSFQLSAIPTSTSLQSSAQTIVGPGVVTFTATITPSAASGTVQFVPTVNGIQEATGIAQVVNGQAVLKANLLSTATYSIVATFVPANTGDFLSSTSFPALVQENDPAPTSTVLTESATTVDSTGSVTFTTTTTPVAAGVAVFVADGTKQLGSFETSGGVASVTVSAASLGAGTHVVSAGFGSIDPAYADSLANSVVVTVNAPALGGGGAVTLSSPVAAVGPSLLGAKQIGQVEQVVSGTWSGSPSPTFTYQWLRDGKAIKGATSSKYTLTSADYKHHISAQVIASNAAGSVAAVTSSFLPKVGNKATVKNLKLKGSVVHGKKVQVSIGTWSVSKLTFSYQWKLNGKAIKGATKSSYTLPASSRHATLTLVVTAKESGFTTTVVTTKSVRVG